VFIYVCVLCALCVLFHPETYISVKSVFSGVNYVTIIITKNYKMYLIAISNDGFGEVMSRTFCLSVSQVK
jgi:hypothetical protein